jgi:antitoxin ParD1/3/4
MRAALRALDREEAAVDEWLRRRVDEALADPRPNVPAEEVFKRLRSHHARRVKGRRREKI